MEQETNVFSGKTIDEAIFIGLQTMGVSLDEVEITTVQHESKGLFGIGAKKALVRLTRRETPVVPVFEKREDRPKSDRPREDRLKSDRPREDRPKSDRPREDRPKSDRPREDRLKSDRPREDRPKSDRPREDRPKSDRPREDRPKSDRPREDRPEAINAEPEQELPEDENALPRDWGGIEYSRELADSDPDAQFLSGMLEAMQLKCSVLAAETDDGLKLIVESDTDGLLIGRHGETLDAIQYIVSHHANRHRKEAGPRRISIDTEGYRVRREETLRKLARRNAARVVKTGRSMAMEPMNPYERRVLHYALQNFRGVTTHSEGEEPNRRVIITPTKK